MKYILTIENILLILYKIIAFKMRGEEGVLHTPDIWIDFYSMQKK